MSFKAKYHGICDNCDEDIRPGDEVDYVQYGTYRELAHVACPEPSTSGKRREVCSECCMELPVSGICGTCD